MKAETNINELEAKKQREIMERLKIRLSRKSEELGRPLTYNSVCFGCQMNAKDSEKLEGILETIGYVKTDSEEADFLIMNTCTVRENANLRVYGRLGQLKKYKKKNTDMMIALCGCMMQESLVVEKIKQSYRHVDIIFGTHNVFKLAELIEKKLDSEGMVIDIWDGTTEIVEDLPSDRKYNFKCGVNIMFGCNNFCSYCIVPYVRGRERSRKPEDIISEIKSLVADGVSEVMLLGQNVNSYGRNLEKPITFAELLERVEQIDGLMRIRFMTSHPKDLSDELIAVMAKSSKICKHLHLPMQSGSTKVLSDMNRRYTKEEYLTLVDKIRKAVPDISLTTDIIVGFPTETEADFEETLDVVRRVRFDSAFTFIYSKRTGTPAASMEAAATEKEVKARFDRLLNEVQDIAKETCKRFEGSIMEVLVEGLDEQDESLLTGRLSNNLLVHFPGEKELVGSFQNVKLVESKGFYYMGEIS
ncbi:MAG: tRNA (N6-isopentenyl adenosine(37)-C2)-methylthiotransferase MiaB [Lachnospiraceae bacterium]|nr:tRNA (N6-isopentenyl adenosine(37)-C2)-methylthiotransferase MiaB [Lachnospiraceae bacterium]